MSIGKDSIQKRVAKEAPVETVEKVAEKAPATEKKAPAKKACGTKAPTTKPATTAKKPTAKKPATKAPATTVLGNVSPEVVEKVTGNKENTTNAFKRVAVTDEMPYYLL